MRIQISVVSYLLALTSVTACGDDALSPSADAGIDAAVRVDARVDASLGLDAMVDANVRADADVFDAAADLGADGAVDGDSGTESDAGFGEDGGIDAARDAGPMACSIAGQWRRPTGSPQTFYMHFGADSTFYFTNDPAFPELRLIVRTSWSATDAQLTLSGTDPGGTADECDLLTGVYDYTLSADCNTATFTVVSDECDGRDGGVAFAWMRAGPDVDPCLIPDGDADGHARHTCGGDDCNNFDGSTYPGATETCNGNDDDCDRAIDDGFECAAGATLPCTTSCGEPSTTTCSASCASSCAPPTSLTYVPGDLPALCGTTRPDGARCVAAPDSCYVAYGQYVRSLAAGDYVARFVVSAPGSAGATVLLDVNDAVDGAGVVASATRIVVAGGDMTVALPFTAPGLCHRLEFRVVAVSGELCLHSIDVR